MQHHTKLEAKWKGPYEIGEALPRGAYRLKIDGKISTNTVNGNWLKLYHGRQNKEPIIVIENRPL